MLFSCISGVQVLEKSKELRKAVTMRQDFLDKLPQGVKFFHPLQLGFSSHHTHCHPVMTWPVFCLLQRGRGMQDTQRCRIGWTARTSTAGISNRSYLTIMDWERGVPRFRGKVGDSCHTYLRRAWCVLLNFSWLTRNGYFTRASDAMSAHEVEQHVSGSTCHSTCPGIVLLGMLGRRNVRTALYKNQTSCYHRYVMTWPDT